MDKRNILWFTLMTSLGFVLLASADGAMGDCGQGCGHGSQKFKRPYECTIDLRDGYDCSGPVEVLAYEFDESLGDLAMALVRIDMQRYYEARVTIEYGPRSEWVTDLGNSVTNNGACGDAATNTLDSEFDVRNETLRVCTNDTDPGRLHVEDVLTVGEPASVTYVVQDGYLNVRSSENPLELEFRSDALFQLDGFDEEAQAENDRVFWLGLNRVIADTSRRGQGAAVAEITLVPKRKPHGPTW